MPQLFQVLRCYKCLVFQVHQTKKSNKWECKLCGEKQSIKRHYGLGTGKECRIHVQKLNGVRGTIDEIKRNYTDSDELENDEDFKETIVDTKLQKESKWSSYIDESETSTIDNNDTMYLNNTVVVLEVPQKRRKCFGKLKSKALKSVETNNCFDETNLNNSQVNVVPLVDTCTIQFNESKPVSLKEKLPYISLASKEINITKRTVKKFMPPAISMNSKWAQYAEEDDERTNENSDNLNELLPNIKKAQKTMSNALFSLHDDSDLDNILDL